MKPEARAANGLAVIESTRPKRLYLIELLNAGKLSSKSNDWLVIRSPTIRPETTNANQYTWLPARSNKNPETTLSVSIASYWFSRVYHMKNLPVLQ